MGGVTAQGRRVTLGDVAAAAGVSRMTASYAYSQPARVAEATRLRVLAAAEQLGFLGPDPSGRFLRQGSLRSLGLVLGESLDYVFDDPQATRFVAGLAKVCTATGYALTIIPTTGEPQDSDRIAAAAVDAFVVWTTTADDPVLDAVRATHRRAVIHGGPPTEGFALVGIDNRAAARALAVDVWATSSAPAVLSFPLDRERRAGVHSGLDPQRVAYPVTRDRLAGFRDAADDLWLDWSTVPIAVCALNDPGHAREATTLLCASHQFDGLATMSDQQALGAREALLATGRSIPADVTLGGFDDSPQAAATNLTSVRQSLHDQGTRAATLALRGAGHPAAASARTLDDWQLNRRASTLRR
jgi:DNA-binding LacI/PurR family transcriptional regulator